MSVSVFDMCFPLTKCSMHNKTTCCVLRNRSFRQLRNGYLHKLELVAGDLNAIKIYE